MADKLLKVLKRLQPLQAAADAYLPAALLEPFPEEIEEVLTSSRPWQANAVGLNEAIVARGLIVGLSLDQAEDLACDVTMGVDALAREYAGKPYSMKETEVDQVISSKLLDAVWGLDKDRPAWTPWSEDHE